MKFKSTCRMLLLGLAISSQSGHADELTDSITGGHSVPQIRTTPVSVVPASSASASASSTDNPGLSVQCTQQSWQGTNPQVITPEMTQSTTLLCFDEFTVNYSGVSKTPLWVSEHLTASRIAKAEQTRRVNRFHAETLLPPAWQSQLADYKDPVYDRGHMAPSGDMSNPQAQYQSFSLANIAPQEGHNNRETWADIEMATRAMTKNYGEVYVVTGPVFATREVDTLNDVMIPTHFYKAIYIPSQNRASAWVSTNQQKKELKVVSLQELDQIAGIRAFPTLPVPVRSTRIWLPANAGAAMRQNKPSGSPRSPSRQTVAIGPFELSQKTLRHLIRQVALP